MLPAKNADYGSKDYWNKRFEEETAYDWLCDYSLFKSFFNELVPEKSARFVLCTFHNTVECRIVHVGCGTSKLSQQMQADGFTDITNVDYSEALIRRCAEEYPEQKWLCADMRRMEALPSTSADVVIEKATLDSLFVGERVRVK